MQCVTQKQALSSRIWALAYKQTNNWFCKLYAMLVQNAVRLMVLLEIALSPGRLLPSCIDDAGAGRA